MSPGPKLEESDRQLSREADLVRARLALTLEALERKRRRWASVVPVVLAAVASAFFVAGVALAVASSCGFPSRSRRALSRARWRMLARAYQHPERVARSRSPEARLLGASAILAAMAARGLRDGRAWRDFRSGMGLRLKGAAHEEPTQLAQRTFPHASLPGTRSADHVSDGARRRGGP